MKALTRDHRRFYEENGYLLLPKFISDEWLGRLREVTERFIDESRTLTTSSHRILVEPGHRPDAPRLRRIPQTVAFDPVFEEFGLRGPIVDIAEDLLGPNVRFHHSKLNFKWSSGGEEIKWHQDIQFWPHSNYSPLTIGVYLEDVADEMAPMGVVAGSHRGELFSLCDANGAWIGALDEDDLRRVPFDRTVWFKGPRASVTVHNCRMIHGSKPNLSPRMRPLLLHTYAAGDAQPLTDLMHNVPFANVMVRGREAKPRFDPMACPMPPDWKAGQYTSIFDSQRPQS